MTEMSDYHIVHKNKSPIPQDQCDREVLCRGQNPQDYV